MWDNQKDKTEDRIINAVFYYYLLFIIYYLLFIIYCRVVRLTSGGLF